MLSHLPVIIGMGGISPAGRSSGHHGLRRVLFDSLTASQQTETLISLATLTGIARPVDGQTWQTPEGNLSTEALLARYQTSLLDSTLIRRIHPDWFDVEAQPTSAALTLQPGEQPISFILRRRQLPQPLPVGWQISEVSASEVLVTVKQPLSVVMPTTQTAPVQAAGLLPTGFNPARFYRSANHPRALQMAVFGASDLLGQSGLNWPTLAAQVKPDQIGVFASNSIGQMDQEGWGGLLQSPVTGKRTTSKQMPLGYAQMTADFINAYVLGNVGPSTGALGACATFLYNLQLATQSIRSGRLRIALVGTADAPVTPEIIEGFRAMGALADDASLRALDKLDALSEADYRRACRPFAPNCGFTLAESAQFILLVDDALALQTGAQILGSVPDVFCHADGFKRSISAPGVGNYLTLAKAAALGRSLLGDQALQQRSYVHAHGTSTPKNRVTESHVLNQVAKGLGIDAWPVAAIKAFVGHSQGTAGGDQLMAALGSWSLQRLPGIRTVETFADDLHASHLALSNQDLCLQERPMDMALINAKGFGGNNASALVLSPEVTQKMLEKRHGKAACSAHAKALENTLATSLAHEQACQRGEFRITYQFGEQVLEGHELELNAEALSLPGYAQAVDLMLANPFEDMV